MFVKHTVPGGVAKCLVGIHNYRTSSSSEDNCSAGSKRRDIVALVLKSVKADWLVAIVELFMLVVLALRVRPPVEPALMLTELAAVVLSPITTVSWPVPVPRFTVLVALLLLPIFMVWLKAPEVLPI